MRKITVIGLSVAFVALCMYSRAHAQEAPPEGSRVTINQPMIQCDTSEMIKAIAMAKLTSDAAAQAKYDEYAKVIDAHNEPSCVFGRATTVVTIEESIALPDLAFGEIQVHAYALHLDTPYGNWWGMYVTPKAADKDTSI